jgi:hypothetical protein
MKLTLPKLVRSESGLFLPDRPKYEILQVASAKIEKVRFEGLDDFLNALHKEDFPFGLTLGLRTTNYTNFHTGMRIPNPEDIVYFLDVGKVGHLNKLDGKDVYVHYSPYSKTWGVTFSEQA